MNRARNESIFAVGLSLLVGCGSASLKPQGSNDGGPDVGSGGGSGGASPEAGSGGTGGAGVDAGPEVPACAGTCVAPFASSSDWSVYDDDPVTNPAAQKLGAAQPVCLNATSPPNCPPGAVLYGFGNAWGLSLTAIPGALWVWGPGVSASAPADLKRFVFVHTFTLGATPSGTVSVAADDAAEVRVNGHVVGAAGSVTDVAAASVANMSLTTFDLSPRLVAGSNTIAIVGTNGPASFAGCPTACTYSMNPAGIVFGGSLTYH